jgi:hypothetical protein
MLKGGGVGCCVGWGIYGGCWSWSCFGDSLRLRRLRHDGAEGGRSEGGAREEGEGEKMGVSKRSDTVRVLEQRGGRLREAETGRFGIVWLCTLCEICRGEWRSVTFVEVGGDN